jgi:hypothetical protein
VWGCILGCLKKQPMFEAVWKEREKEKVECVGGGGGGDGGKQKAGMTATDKNWSSPGAV